MDDDGIATQMSLESQLISAAAVDACDGGQTHVHEWYPLSAFSLGLWNTVGEVLHKDMDWRKLNKVSIVGGKSLLNQVPVKVKGLSGEELAARNDLELTD
ncbi:hypothetical protein ACH5RR_024814 [Cinchona calisaya]|uniref:Uncharacterized protein n=1 Tax=Cinchona calisaya TaxID=153742 RepID=A0ABD2YXW0_9GENT